MATASQCRAMALPQTALKSQRMPRVKSKTAYEQTTAEIEADMGRCKDQFNEF